MLHGFNKKLKRKMDGKSSHFSFSHIGVVVYYTGVMSVTLYRNHPTLKLILAFNLYVFKSSRIIIRNDQFLLEVSSKGIAYAFQFYYEDRVCLDLVMKRRLITTILPLFPSSSIMQAPLLILFPLVLFLFILSKNIYRTSYPLWICFLATNLIRMLYLTKWPFPMQLDMRKPLFTLIGHYFSPTKLMMPSTI